MSPSHHTRHTDAKLPAVISSVTTRLATPMVAATAVLTPAASTTSAKTSRTRPREGRKSATWDSRNAPSSASSVFPQAMPNVAASGIPVHEFARNAPIATPGHRR